MPLRPRRPRSAFLPLSPLPSPPHPLLSPSTPLHHGHLSRRRATAHPPTRAPPRAQAAPSPDKSAYIDRMRASLRARCLSTSDPFWATMQDEARAAAADEPLLASFMFATVLNHASLQSALAFHLANKLASPAIPATQLMRLFTDFMDDACDGGVGNTCDPQDFVRKDLLAVMERDPACVRFIDCLCYYKGFHALQAYRIAHALWRAGRFAVAYHLQAQVSKELQVDIHPAAVIGPGAFFDHATGLVIGETAVIGENVSMLHHVTLGGSGKKHGVRHPQIGRGVLLGAGATLLGDVRVGDGAQIGACSLVLENVPERATVVGVPARVVMVGDPMEDKVVPALDMKHERCLQRADDNVVTSSSQPQERREHREDHGVVGDCGEKGREKTSVNGVADLVLPDIVAKASSGGAGDAGVVLEVGAADGRAEDKHRERAVDAGKAITVDSGVEAQERNSSDGAMHTAEGI